MTVITIAIFVFEIIPPLNVVRLTLNSAIDKVIIKMSVRRMIVSLPTLLYGSLSTSALAMASTITPGKTDIIGIKKVNVSRRHPNVKTVPITSPSKFIFSSKFSYDVTVKSPAVAWCLSEAACPTKRSPSVRQVNVEQDSTLNLHVTPASANILLAAGCLVTSLIFYKIRNSRIRAYCH